MLLLQWYKAEDVLCGEEIAYTLFTLAQVGLGCLAMQLLLLNLHSMDNWPPSGVAWVGNAELLLNTSAPLYKHISGRTPTHMHCFERCEAH